MSGFEIVALLLLAWIGSMLLQIRNTLGSLKRLWGDLVEEDCFTPLGNQLRAVPRRLARLEELIEQIRDAALNATRDRS